MSKSMSMYQASIPGFIQALKGLKAVLAKGEAHAKERGVEPSELLNACLAPDMFALTRQVQIATDHCKRVATCLAGRQTPSWSDEEESFAELQARIAKTIDFMEAVKPEDIDGSENIQFTLKVGPNEVDFTGLPYLIYFAIPNFYFHVTTAYDILRANGVEVGKRDFLGR